MSSQISSLVWLGLVVHLVLFYSIFDVYFTSPIARDVDVIVNDITPPAKRLVIISIDGLRFDALQETDPETGTKTAPYLWKVMRRWSTWGISQTHLPTESRPGHVAMLAGFYEDPSAVTKGWKENPVDFDSIFNQSACSFAWGSPDIVDIFYKDLKHKCGYKWTYKDTQDFAGNTMELDNWVHYEVEKFFHHVNNSKLYSTPQSIFFLHLLGQDTSGHTHKPHTRRYRENLRNVDRIVRHVVDLFAGKFPDNKTAFLVTADHGMTDWGSHGAGDPSETLTPIVAWGSGVRIQRTDEPNVRIDQADIVPLMATLIGISIPVNSVGILPTEFLNMSNTLISEAIFLNARQISAQYIAKRSNIEDKLSLLLYKKFHELDRNRIKSLQSKISDYIRQSKLKEANTDSMKLIELSFEGINFYHNYFQRPLFFVISLSYLCWIALLLLNLSETNNIWLIPSSAFRTLIGTSLLNGVIVYREQLPLTYYVYITLCSFLLIQVLFQSQLFIPLVANMYSLKNVLVLAIVLLGIEILVLGFFYRWAYTLSLMIKITWCVKEINPTNLKISMYWIASGLCLAVFTVLPVVGKQPEPTFTLVAVIFIFVGQRFKIDNIWAVLRISGLLAAALNSFYVHKFFSTDWNLSIISQTISWCLLVIAIVLLFEPADGIFEKCNHIFTALCIPFILLSISHEALFLPILCFHLVTWLRLEMTHEEINFSALSHQPYARKTIHSSVITIKDCRRAYMFLTYIFVAFFGIGNMATLNSFDPAWVRCFLTTFSPFTMTILILLKVIIPFFVVSLAMRVLTLVLNISVYKMFVTILIYLNVMGLNFLFFVKNEGSWLDIGTSLSHYVIQQVTIVFLLTLFFLAQYVLGPKNGQKFCKNHDF